ncbi:MAG: ABC transporter substrate-binding protein [Candidatus Hodarchaeota archaeon]
MRKVGYSLLLIITICVIPLFFIIKSTEPEVQGLEWYFDNLDDDDRRKIRQAMDYAIPRQEIIDKLHGGLANILATEIAPNMMGFDYTVRPREYNITMAKKLLVEVFGKWYDNSTDTKPDGNITNTPYFSMVLISPTACCRQDYPLWISQSFKEIGIDVEIKWWNWNLIMPRIYLEPISPGFNYEHGGVDAWFWEMKSHPDPNLSSEYLISGFPPAGDNAFWCENQEVIDILNRSLTELDVTDRLEALSEFQYWFYNEVPKSIIFQPANIFAMDENLEGFDPYLVGKGWCFNNWSISDQTTMSYAVPGYFVDFNLLLSNSYYDCIPMTNVMGTLAQRRGTYNLTHLVPQIAKNWINNVDGTIWEVIIRNGIKWDDGAPLTAEDVIFTYHAVFEDTLSSPKKNFFLDRFPGGLSDIYLKSGTNDTIVFELGAFYPYVTSQIFNLPILQKKQFENIPFSDWKIHSLNTGMGDEYIHGCGPYMMTDFDPETGVKLEINPYFNQNIFGHDPAAIGGGIWYSNPTIQEIYLPLVREETTAIAGLSAGIYDVLDLEFHIQNQYLNLSAPNNDYNSKCIIFLDEGWQELNYNHYDSRWGMNAHNPREMYEVNNGTTFFQKMSDEFNLTMLEADVQNAVLWIILIAVVTIGMALFINKILNESSH